MKYKVLWIDDQPNDSFIVDAEAYEMDIHVETCYDNGIAWLRANLDICMAVILDVKCKITDDPNEGDTPEAFKERWAEVYALCNKDSLIPWFVYTSGDYQGVEELNLLPANKIYDKGHRYYNKPADRKQMFENIRMAIENRDIVGYLKKYEDVLYFCPQMAKELFRVIKIVELNDYTNTSAFNDMRKVLGWTTAYMRDHGLLPVDLTKLSSATYYLRSINDTAICTKRNKRPLKDIVPDYIRYGFETCEDVCNNGSHGKMEGSTNDANNLIVDKVVASGDAPYLIRSTFYKLLDIITWCKKLPTTEEGVENLRKKIANLEIPFDPNK